MKIVKIGDKLGIVQIESKIIQQLIDQKTGEQFEIKSLNNVILEDGTIKLVGDTDMEEVNDDRTEEFNKEIEQLYN